MHERHIMNIAIDANEANVEQRVGVSVYTLELLLHFHREASSHKRFVIYLKNKPLPHMPAETEYFRYHVLSPRMMWLNLALPVHFALKKPDIDVYFAPAHYAPWYCPYPLVTTIHDLAYEYFPNEFLTKDLYTLRKWTRASVTRATRIVAVSNNTKKDLTSLYKVSPSTIRVVHNGFTLNNHEHESAPTASSQAQYLLYVGTLQPRKNVARLISAFSIILKKHPTLTLKIVGKKGWMYEEILATARRLDIEHAVEFTGYVSEDEKRLLYEGALAFVMPSLYEGFCIPVLEAMSAGCPVACANTSCLPEVAGDACIFFDPLDTTDIARAIGTLVENPQIRKVQIAKGVKNVAKFSWKQSAEETLQILENAAQHTASK